MHLRRIACLLLGAWMAGTLVVGWLATSNFDAVDHVLSAAPAEFQKTTAGLDADHLRRTLRYLVAVENADYFLTWELVEFGLALVICAILLVQRRTRLLAAFPLAVFLIVLFQHFRITPEIAWLGQSLTLGGGIGHQREQFSAMHRMYGVLEVLKLILTAVLAVWLVTTTTGRRTRRSSSDAESGGTLPRRRAS